MKVQYDAEAEACYLEVTTRPVARTVHLHDGVMVDVDDAGEPVGVEFLWGRDDVPVEALTLVVERFPSSERSCSEKRCSSPEASRQPAPPRRLAVALFTRAGVLPCLAG